MKILVANENASRNLQNPFLLVYMLLDKLFIYTQNLSNIFDLCHHKSGLNGNLFPNKLHAMSLIPWQFDSCVLLICAISAFKLYQGLVYC